MKTFFLTLGFLLAAASLCMAWPAKIVEIIDGDTVTVAPLGILDSPIAIRLAGIDAPESAQPGGKAATAYLKKIATKLSEVEIVPFGNDRYGRVIALVATPDICLNSQMVAEGHAWVDEKHCKAKFCGKWLSLQEKAKALNLGIWRDSQPTPPWEWRKNKP